MQDQIKISRNLIIVVSTIVFCAGIVGGFQLGQYHTNQTNISQKYNPFWTCNRPAYNVSEKTFIQWCWGNVNKYANGSRSNSGTLQSSSVSFYWDSNQSNLAPYYNESNHTFFEAIIKENNLINNFSNVYNITVIPNKTIELN